MFYDLKNTFLWAFTLKGTRELSGVIEIFFILSVMVIIEVCVVKPY